MDSDESEDESRRDASGSDDELPDPERSSRWYNLTWRLDLIKIESFYLDIKKLFLGLDLVL